MRACPAAGGTEPRGAGRGGAPMSRSRDDIWGCPPLAPNATSPTTLCRNRPERIPPAAVRATWSRRGTTSRRTTAAVSVDAASAMRLGRVHLEPRVRRVLERRGQRRLAVACALARPALAPGGRASRPGPRDARRPARPAPRSAARPGTRRSRRRRSRASGPPAWRWAISSTSRAASPIAVVVTRRCASGSQACVSAPCWLTRCPARTRRPARGDQPTAASQASAPVTGSSGTFTTVPAAAPRPSSSTKPVPGNRYRPELVDRDRHDARVGRVDRLDAVAVVDVEVDVQDAQAVAPRAGDGQGRVVVDAEPRRPIAASRGAARRPDGRRARRRRAGSPPSPGSSRRRRPPPPRACPRTAGRRRRADTGLRRARTGRRREALDRRRCSARVWHSCSSSSVAGSGASPGSAPTARSRSMPGPNRRGVSGWPGPKS